MWREAVRKDVLATIRDFFEDRRIVMSEPDIDELARQIADSIPSPPNAAD